MEELLVFLFCIALAFAIDFAIVSLCYAIIAWAFGIAFSWPIALAIAVVIMFVLLFFRRG